MAVMNYAAQSEMIIHLLKAITVLVVNKEYRDVDATIRVSHVSNKRPCAIIHPYLVKEVASFPGFALLKW